MDPIYADGLRILAVGVVGVFANLALVMLVVIGIGKLVGKKKKAS